MDFFKKKNNIVLKSSNPSPNEEKESTEKVLLNKKLPEMKSTDKDSLDNKLPETKATDNDSLDKKVTQMKLTEMNSPEMKSSDKNSLEKKLTKMKLTEMQAPEMKSKEKESTEKQSPETAQEKEPTDKKSPETKEQEKQPTDKESPETKAQEKEPTDQDSSETKAQEKQPTDQESPETKAQEKKSKDQGSPETKAQEKELTDQESPKTNAQEKESTVQESPETKAQEKESTDKETPETKSQEKQPADKEAPETNAQEKESTDQESPETKAQEKQPADKEAPETNAQEKQPTAQTPLKKELSGNLQTIKAALGESSDIIIREIRIGKEGSVKAAVVYTDGLSDATSLQNFILETLMIDIKELELDSKITSEPNLLKTLKDFAMTVGEIKDLTTLEDLYTSLLSGDAIILIDGYSKGFIVGNKHWIERGVTEPTAQTVVRGPREAFSENLRINTALVRRIIKDPNLWMESMVIGKRSKTNIAIMYIKDVVDDSVLEELRTRLDRIDIDGILESAYIEELIQDSKYSPFPTVYNTERPDSTAASLLEGQIAILIDGTPFVLIVPALFTQFFQSVEDYYQRAEMATLLRLLRFFAFGISILAPGLYIAIITFQHEMLPAPLLISLAAQRENVPFPAFIEVVIMEIAFEILREAGLRMPRVIGAAMSIVGGFVVGTAAVEAGIISAAMVIVVSITAIASFVSPSYDIAIAGRMLRFIFIALAAMFGFYGMIIGLIALILHLCSLSSFGVPYMSPLAPFNASAQKDVFIRVPLLKMTTRPSFLSKNKIRQRYAAPKSDKDK